MNRGGKMLAEHVRAAYGLATAGTATFIPAARGAVGQIWRLDLGAERYAVKELFRDADEDSVRREAAFTAHAAANGVRLPACLPDPDGRFLVRKPEELGGGWLRLYQWVDGAPVDLADPDLADQLGELLGRLHVNALPAQGGADPWYESAPDPSAWSRLVDSALAQGADWGPALAERVDLLLDLTELASPAALDRMITCHRDLHPANVLVDGSGELVLIDWDDVGPACPDRELAKLVVDWLVHDGKADTAAVIRTLAAYRAAGGRGQLRDEKTFGMIVAADLNFLESQACNALRPEIPPEHREYAVAEIWESLGRLPQRTLLAGLLELADAR